MGKLFLRLQGEKSRCCLRLLLKAAWVKIKGQSIVVQGCGVNEDDDDDDDD